ncbi:hypothetical protein [Parasphingorhabdus sp.]|uniref:hypothetical protein n=1 Tax=Parasphingorhabdus sp. TaxID=2709688 RepID=UPI003A8FC9B8
MLKRFFLAISLIAPGTAIAADSVSLSSNVYVERKVAKSDGTTAVVLEQPTTVIPGDQLVFVVKYKNVGSAPASEFSVTNPLPKAVAFNGTSDGTEIVSVDGGKTWGPLSALTYPSENGDVRPALMTDVTHLKWKFNRSLSVGSEGELVFRGTVK